MKKKLFKQLVPLGLTAILLAGCGTQAATAIDKTEITSSTSAEAPITATVIKEHTEDHKLAEIEDGYYFIKSADDPTASLFVDQKSTIRIDKKKDDAAFVFRIERDKTEKDTYVIRPADEALAIEKDKDKFAVKDKTKVKEELKWTAHDVSVDEKDVRIEFVAGAEEDVFSVKHEKKDIFVWVLEKINDTKAKSLIDTATAKNAEEKNETLTAEDTAADTSKDTTEKEADSNKEAKTETTGGSNTTQSHGDGASGSSGTSGNTGGGNTGSGNTGGGSNTTGSTGSTSKPTQQPTHTHSWTDITQTDVIHHNEEGHYETVTVQAAWDEQVPIYETVWVPYCNGCGMEMTSISHLDECPKATGSWTDKKKQVQTGTQTIHHDAVTEQRWVVDKAAWDETVTRVIGQKCTSCGATN